MRRRCKNVISCQDVKQMQVEIGLRTHLRAKTFLDVASRVRRRRIRRLVPLDRLDACTHNADTDMRTGCNNADTDTDMPYVRATLV